MSYQPPDVATIDFNDRVIRIKDCVYNIDNVLREYEKPDRSYHDINHLKRMVKYAELFDVKLTLAQCFAIAYHDAVYIPGLQGISELHSGLLFRNHWKNAFPNPYSSITVEIAERIIYDTRDHLIPSAFGSDLVLDLDLAGIGDNINDPHGAQFKIDGDNIRTEYQAIDDVSFYKGRRQFLKNMLERPRIYHTHQFFTAFEATARQRITDDIRRCSTILEGLDRNEA